MIVIVDYQMGNLASILNMLKRVGVPAKISNALEDISAADKLILPGVGAFDNGMLNIHRLGLLPVLNRKVLESNTPVLGICLGMQLLTDGSEEGSQPGLGWLAGRTVRFQFEPNAAGLKIPHMGWNSVEAARGDGRIMQGFHEDPRFYFVHSYHIVCDHPEDVLTTTEYGYRFASSVHRGNIYGTQFHPEKSHRFGMKLLANFAALQ